MSKKSSVQMSFQVATSEQAAPQQQQQQQQTVQAQQVEKRTTRQGQQPATRQPQMQQSQQSTGRFDHIKDNIAAQKRYDQAFASMSLRAGRAGDQFDVERKLEKRYDDDVKLGTTGHILDWISTVLQGEIEPINSTDAKQVHKFLKDGIVLCRLVNRLLKRDNKDPIGYSTKSTNVFAGASNLESFLTGATRYGIPQESIFQPNDLREGRKGQLPNVLQCLNALGCVANLRGFQPAYVETPPPKADWCKSECYD